MQATPVTLPQRIDVIGSKISACDTAQALRVLEECLRERTGGYVCFTNVHSAVLGRRDPSFQAITNGSLLSVADGKPIYWLGQFKRDSGLGWIAGPDFVGHALRQFRHRSHFFYGSTPEVLARLVSTIHQTIPGIRISGALSPPFRSLTTAERIEHYRIIRDSGADFVWVGLGAPKQEQWMAEACQALSPCILLGVGAAFDFHSGSTRRAPRSVQHVGLEWLYRLLMEPRRLWRRYLSTNTLFIWYALADLINLRQPRLADNGPDATVSRTSRGAENDSRYPRTPTS